MYRDDLFELRDSLKLQLKALKKLHDIQPKVHQDLGNGATLDFISGDSNLIKREMRTTRLKIDGVTELIKGTTVRGPGPP